MAESSTKTIPDLSSMISSVYPYTNNERRVKVNGTHKVGWPDTQHDTECIAWLPQATVGVRFRGTNNSFRHGRAFAVRTAIFQLKVSQLTILRGFIYGALYSVYMQEMGSMLHDYSSKVHV